MPESFERGALTEAVYYILLSLYKPTHGYAIMQNINSLTRGRISLGPGTLYGAINTLIEKKWITSVVSMVREREPRKKEYLITDAGKAAVENEIERLRELLENGRTITEKFEFRADADKNITEVSGGAVGN